MTKVLEMAEKTVYKLTVTVFGLRQHERDQLYGMNIAGKTEPLFAQIAPAVMIPIKGECLGWAMEHTNRETHCGDMKVNVPFTVQDSCLLPTYADIAYRVRTLLQEATGTVYGNITCAWEMLVEHRTTFTA